MGRWDKIGSWVGDGVRREVFFFSGPGGAELFGSLYAAQPLMRPFGVVICNSWGIEGDQASRLVHPLALTAARAGGAGLVFHYPGHGDSSGDPGALTMESMAGAAADAAREGRRRLPPGSAWGLAGFMLGASVAALATRRLGAEALLLGQPALRPGEYFERLERRARRLAALTRSGDETAFGYTPPLSLLGSAAAAGTEVAAALGRFGGTGAVVRYSSPNGTDEVPARFERIEVEGAWRFASPDDSKLGRAAGEWLKSYMARRG